MIRQALNDSIDQAVRSGEMSEQQANNWSQDRAVRRVQIILENKGGHDHESFESVCPKCGLAPKLPRNPLTAWGFEYLTKTLAPCVCGGSPVLIQGGSPTAYRYYCQARCGLETATYEDHPEAVLKWNELQISKGFDARKLHPLNQV
jgi:hypothetical protein